MVQKLILSILNGLIPLESKIFLLNIFPKGVCKEMKYILINMITAARIVYVQHLKSAVIPSREMEISKIYGVIEMDNLT